jgi:hypothetical protein
MVVVPVGKVRSFQLPSLIVSVCPQIFEAIGVQDCLDRCCVCIFGVS